MNAPAHQIVSDSTGEDRLFIWDGISVHTEITNKTGKDAAAGWLAYDAGCAFCVAMARGVEGLLARRGIGLAPLHAGWVRARLGFKQGEQADRMWLLLRSGANFGGGDALIEIARRVWWARPVAWLARLPGARRLINAGYMLVARRRACISGACEVGPRPRRGASVMTRIIDWLPLIAATIVALCAQSALPAWAFMWALALAIFAGCKWLMYRLSMRNVAGRDKVAPAGTKAPSLARKIGYFLAWPGLDAAAFLAPPAQAKPATLRDWFGTGLNLAIGSSFITMARIVPADQPLFAGWVFMIGLIFLLHFGAARAMTLAWRNLGVSAPLMMENPAAASSLSEFWGKRWNRDFRVLAHEIIFKPAHRLLSRLGAARAAGGAMLAVFLVSGLVHDLVISLPAGAGFGLPTGYFLVQAAGLWFERSRTGRRLGLGRGMRGRLYTLTLTALPAFALFHPDFVVNVIVPFARAIGVMG